MCDPSPGGAVAIHGRFQPFHSGHMRYLLLALAEADLVYIGITNPQAPALGRFEGSDPVRHDPLNNPLTLEQRTILIRAALLGHSPPISLERVRIVGFDVSADPDRWAQVIPLEAVQLVAPHEPWDHVKAQRFEAAGYEVRYLPTEEGRTTATFIRSLIRERNPLWRELLPPGTAAVLEASEMLDVFACTPHNHPTLASETKETA